MRNHIAHLVLGMIIIMMAVSPKQSLAEIRSQVGVLAASVGSVQLRNSTVESSPLTTAVSGTPIFLYDEVVTGENTKAQILMMDETTFSIGENTTLIIDEFVFDRDDQASGLISTNVTKGVFRFISGRIAKANPANMNVKAGNAVISVRGTEVIGTIAPEASTIVLLSGQIDMQSTSDVCQGGGAGCSQELTRPGFGVELSAQGQFSAPTRFDPEDISQVISSLDLQAEEGGTEEGAEEEEAAEPEEATQADDAEEKPEETALAPQDEDEATKEAGNNAEDEKPENTTTLSVVVNGEEIELKPEDTAEVKPEELKPATLNSDELKPEEVILAETVLQNEELKPSGFDENRPKEETPATKRMSDFDKIVMRALGIVFEEDAKQAPETNTMALPTQIENEETDREKTRAVAEEEDRELNEETYEEEVEEATENLTEEQKNNANNQAENNEAEENSNSAPSLTVGSLSAIADTSDDDTFSNVTASASASDEDSGDTVSFGISGGSADTSVSGYTHSRAGTYGTLYINSSTGAYLYAPSDSAVEGLTATATDSFTLTASDGTDTTNQELSATLSGVNDTPVLAVVTSSSYTDTDADDSFTATSASLSGSDRDDSPSLTYGITGSSEDTSVSGYTHSREGSYGTIYINSSSGAYRYVPDDGDIEGLKSSAQESFAMTLSDGTASVRQTYAIDITGANDAPSLASVSGMSFTDTSADDSFSNATATLSGADRDSGETLTYSITSGSADTSVSGYTHSRTGAYGTLYLNSSSGAYLYQPNDSAIEGLKTDASDQFTFSVSDGALSASQTLTASVTGVNDTPVLGSIAGISFTDTSSDDSFSDSTGTASATDRDSGDSLTYGITGGSADSSVSGYTHSLAGSYGTLYINSTSGAYIYDVSDSGVEGASSTVTDSFEISASDGTASSTTNLVATVNGANDTPILASITGITVTDTSSDDSFTATSASLSGSDRDTGQSLSYSITSGSVDTSVSGFTHSRAGTYGTLYVNSSSGAYRFIPNDSAVEGLSSTVTEDFVLNFTDGTTTVSETLTTSLQGVNDTPSLASITGTAYTDTSADDSFAPQTGNLNGSDRDTGTDLKYEVAEMAADSSVSGYDRSVSGSYGDLFLNQSTGAYAYRPEDAKMEALSSTVTESFTISTSDGSVSSSSETITFTINGVDDAPVIDASMNPASQFVGTSGTRIAEISDPEGTAITDSSASIEALPAWLSFGSSGSSPVQYYWEVGANSAAWLNGSKTVQLKGTSNSLDSSTASVNVTFTCNSDNCDDFIKSTDTVTPVTVADATNINAPINNDTLSLGGTTYTFMTQSQRDALFDTSGNESGTFRVIYTADEANASTPGTWNFDQTVTADYSKQEVVVSSSVSFSNIEYFDGDSGSFNYVATMDFSGGQSIYSGKDALFHDNSYPNTGLTKGGAALQMTMRDYVGFMQDSGSGKAAVILTSINPNSSNGAGYNDYNRDLVEEEWRVLEPQ